MHALAQHVRRLAQPEIEATRTAGQHGFFPNWGTHECGARRRPLQQAVGWAKAHAINDQHCHELVACAVPTHGGDAVIPNAWARREDAPLPTLRANTHYAFRRSPRRRSVVARSAMKVSGSTTTP